MSGSPAGGNPAALWLAREEWARRRIKDENRGGGWFLLLFALFWNGIAWTVTLVTWSGQGDRGFEHYFVLLFPAIGAVILLSGLYMLARLARYGVPVFELATLPAPLGRVLAGHVRVPRGLPASSEVRVALRAIHRTVTRSGKNTNTREDVVWETSRILPGVLASGAGMTIPIAIAIPREAPETTVANDNDRILWRLEVQSVVPGVDFLAQFEVPVFYTPESETPLTPEELARIGS